MPAVPDNGPYPRPFGHGHYPDAEEKAAAPEYPLLFVLKPGDYLTIRWMGELRMVRCDRVTPEGAVFRDLTPAELDGEVPARDQAEED